MVSRQAKTNQREAEVARDTATAFGRAFTNGEIDAFLALLAAEVDYEAPSVMQHTVLKLKKGRPGAGVLRRAAGHRRGQTRLGLLLR